MRLTAFIRLGAVGLVAVVAFAQLPPPKFKLVWDSNPTTEQLTAYIVEMGPTTNGPFSTVAAVPTNILQWVIPRADSGKWIRLIAQGQLLTGTTNFIESDPSIALRVPTFPGQAQGLGFRKEPGNP